MLTVGFESPLPEEMSMLGLFLAAWVSFAGKDGEKLPARWDAFCEAWAHRYQGLDNIDWAKAYKSHPEVGGGNNCGPYGRPIVSGCVYVNPKFQWAVPNSCLNVPPNTKSQPQPSWWGVPPY